MSSSPTPDPCWSGSPDRAARVGNDHLVAEHPEMPRDPLALGRGPRRANL